MSKIAVRGNTSGTGVFTVESPGTSVDRTITLPDAGGQIHTSQSVNDHASMPTVGGDLIVESGSNSDGEWTRWADGTQLVTHSIGNPSISADTRWLYPASFSNSPKSIVVLGRTNTNAVFGTGRVPTSTYLDFNMWTTSSARSSAAAALQATGRWK